jgi:hypothetical protein
VVARNGLEVCNVIWRVVPLETPRVLRHCVKCRELRQFSSSDKFRLNAQQQKVDVWLIYKCLKCENTWNCTLVSRRTVKEIGDLLYPRFQQNDRELAWTYAFNFSLLSQAGVQIDASVAVRVERRVVNSFAGAHQERKIRLELPYPGIIRLDRLLAEQFHIARPALQHWLDGGKLNIWPEEKKALRKPARHGQIISLRDDALVS